MKRAILIAVVFSAGIAIGFGVHSLRPQKPEWETVVPPKDLAIFLLIGQSNMTGVAPLDGPQEVDPGLFVFGNDYRWHYATDPLDRSENQVDLVSHDGDFPGVGPGMSFAKTLHELNPELQIGLVPCAKIGASMDAWERDLSDQTLYGSCLKRAKAASVQGEICGILFFQGEKDARKTETAEAWKRKFERFVSDIRMDLGKPDLPIVFAQIGSHDDPQRYPAWDIVQEQQASVDLPGVVIIRTDDLPIGDLAHFTSDSYRTIGERFATGMDSLLVKGFRDGVVRTKERNLFQTLPELGGGSGQSLRGEGPLD